MQAVLKLCFHRPRSVAKCAVELGIAIALYCERIEATTYLLLQSPFPNQNASSFYSINQQREPKATHTKNKPLSVEPDRTTANNKKTPSP